jgi:hypothetical protein
MRRAGWIVGSVVAGVVLLAVGCVAVERVARMPVGASRKTPPPGIGERAPAVGARAPDLTLASTQGEVALSARLADGPAVLVFYRGDW